MQAENPTAQTKRSPSNGALQAAENAARYGRNKAQLRYSFVQRSHPDDPPPPLARMLRGGRGGQVRLKLYLSYLWMQREDTAQGLTFANRAWATLLDLRDPATAGARRIGDAQAWLEENQFIEIVSQMGRPNQVLVLDESGTGQAYVAPGAAARKEAKSVFGAIVHRYVQIPRAFWTSGYLTVLSGAGVAMFLALLCERGPASSDEALWFSPKDAERRFGLSEDTRSKGLRELAEVGLVRTKRRPINPTDFEVVHVRNVHYLDLDRLNETAGIKAAPRRVVRVSKKRTAKEAP
ncbi:hypothetical protein [Streptomyces cyaneus]|uniref:hypothetical protein n=1 Tax=Streptomyces cyaneus TaxID=1904 RepID=UPI000FF88E53|nr:hypothetical protein [Streptomyces cyaneus]